MALREANWEGKAGQLTSTSLSTWLVEQGRKLNLQNRLGFVVSLARQVSGRDPRNEQRTCTFRGLEATVDPKILLSKRPMGGQPKSKASSFSSAEVRRLWEEP